MQKELHEKIYDRFETILYEESILCGDNHTETQKHIASYLPVLKKEFATWQDIIQFRHIKLNPKEREDGLTDVFLMVMRARTRDAKRKQNKQIPVNAVGVKDDLSLVVLNGIAKSGFFRDTPYPDEKNILSFLEAGSVYVEPPKQVERLDDIAEHMLHHTIRDTNRLGERVRRVINTGRLKNGKKTVAKVSDLAASEANAVLREELRTFIDIFRADFVSKEYEFAEAYVQNEVPGQPYTPLQIYNHIHHAGEAQKRDFRKGALIALARAAKNWTTVPLMLGNKDFWRDIDSGLSPFKAAAHYFHVTEGTIKRIYKEQPWIKKHENIKRYAPYLDVIDPSFWPANDSGSPIIIGETQFFEKMVAAAEIYGQTFDREPKGVLKGWVAQQWKNSGKTWAGLAQRILARNYNDVFYTLAQAVGDNPNVTNFFNAYARCSPSKKKDVSIEKVNRLKEQFYNHGRMVIDVLENFEQALNDIEDMKADLEKRLIAPALLLTLLNRGMKVIEPTVIDQLQRSARTAMFGDMSPSDQIAASAYWHSPAVDIDRRRQAVTMTDSNYSEWQPLLDEPIQITTQVVAVSLDTVEKLSIEAKAMNHCVWSYGPSCFTRNYHIVSLQTSDGQKLSTLTLQDYFDSEGKRKVRAIYNLSHHNTQPPPEAVKATDELVERLNNRDIVPDWQAVDAIRAEYKVKQIENAAGYDIHNPELRQSMLDVYAPCIDKKIIKASGKSFDGLIQILEIGKIVDEFLSSFDTSQGGLIRISPVQQKKSGNLHHTP